MPRITPRKVSTARTVPDTSSAFGRCQIPAKAKYRVPRAGRYTNATFLVKSYALPLSIKTMCLIPSLLGLLTFHIHQVNNEEDMAIADNIDAFVQNMTKMFFGIQNDMSRLSCIATARTTPCSISSRPTGRVLHGLNAYKTGNAVVATVAMTK